MTRIASLIFCLLFTSASFALDPAVQKKLDELIASRKATGGQLSKEVRDVIVKFDEFEKRMLPIVFTFNRLAPLLGQRSMEIDQLQAWVADEKNLINPYEDHQWVESARKETAYVCCDVRRNPKLAQEIQENLARGLPALSDATSESVATRAKRAARGMPVVDIETPPPEPAPVASPRAGGGGGQKTGLSTGVISGLPLPSAPAPTPPPAAPPPSAPAPPVAAPAGSAAPAAPAPSAGPAAPADPRGVTPPPQAPPATPPSP